MMKKRSLMTAALCMLLMCPVCISSTAFAEEGENVEPISEEAEAAAEDAVEEAAEELGERPTYTALDYVTVGDYTDLPVQVKEIVITDEMVDSSLASAVSAADKMQEVTEGTVQNGDIANIDYEGKQDGVPFDRGSAQGYDLTIGSGSFIPGFEDGLLDVKIGDTVDLNLTFPENYGDAKLAGAEVVFTVKVNSVKRMPEVTDALVNEISGGSYSTVDGYREYLRQDLEKRAAESQENAIKNELMTQLYNTCQVKDYPQDLVDYSIREMEDYYKSYAQSNNMEFGEFLQTYLGMDETAFRTEAESAVKASLEQELILMAVAEKEGLTEISDEEFKKGCEEYAQELGFPSVDDFMKSYDENRIRLSLALDKAMDFVRENALEVTEEESEALTEAVTEAATE